MFESPPDANLLTWPHEAGYHTSRTVVGAVDIKFAIRS